MLDVASWHIALKALLRVVLFVVPILMIVPFLIWWERRLLSWMQDRIGPNRVGKFGLLQAFADGIKLFTKEDITPSAVDKVIYFVAPAVALFPAFALGGVMPWSANTLLTPVADPNIGVLYVIAISSLGVYGVVLAGYASNNKYSLMGGLRSSAQLISYELAMGMALASIVLATGSLKMSEMVKAQMEPLWGTIPFLHNWFIFTPYGFVAGCVFAICMVAETNRAPFDLPEAENELIAGYHTEYSSMKFAVFFMGEYAAMLIFSAIFSTIFLGGYDLLPLAATEGLSQTTFWGLVAFVGKMATVFTVFIWIRATLPRLRYDQLMAIGWRYLLPIAVANFIVVAVWILYGWVAWAGSAVLLIALYLAIKQLSSKRLETGLQTRSISMVQSGKGVAPVIEAPIQEAPAN